MIQSFCVFICLLWRTCHFNSAGKRICITRTSQNTAVQQSRNRIKVWNEQVMHVVPLWPNEHSKTYCLRSFAQNSQSRGHEKGSYRLTLGSSSKHAVFTDKFVVYGSLYCYTVFPEHRWNHSGSCVSALKYKNWLRLHCMFHTLWELEPQQSRTVLVGLRISKEEKIVYLWNNGAGKKTISQQIAAATHPSTDNESTSRWTRGVRHNQKSYTHKSCIKFSCMNEHGHWFIHICIGIDILKMSEWPKPIKGTIKNQAEGEWSRCCKLDTKGGVTPV